MQRLRTTFTRSRTPTGAEMKTQNSLEVPKQVRSASFDEMQLESQRLSAHFLKQQSSSEERSSEGGFLQVPQAMHAQRSHSFDSAAASAGSDDSGTFLEVPRRGKNRRSSSTKTPPPCIHCLYLEEYEKHMRAEQRYMLDHHEMKNMSYSITSSELSDDDEEADTVTDLAEEDEDERAEEEGEATDDDVNACPEALDVYDDAALEMDIRLGGMSSSIDETRARLPRQMRRHTIGSSVTTSEDEGLEESSEHDSPHFGNTLMPPPPTTPCGITFTLSPTNGDYLPFPTYSFPIDPGSPPASPSFALSVCDSPVMELPPPPPISPLELLPQAPSFDVTLPPPPAFSTDDCSSPAITIATNDSITTTTTTTMTLGHDDATAIAPPLSPSSQRPRRRSISRQEAIFVEPTGNSLENVSQEVQLKSSADAVNSSVDEISTMATCGSPAPTVTAASAATKHALVVRDIYLAVPDLRRDRAASVDSCFSKVSSGNKTEELQPSDGCFLAVPNINATRSRSVDIVLPTDEQARYKALAMAGTTSIYGDGRSAPAISSRRPIRIVPDWTENAIQGEHYWKPSSASGDLCCLNEECIKSGQRMKCSACQLIAHQNCIPLVNEKTQLACKPTYRDVGVRQYREQSVTHHHWVHRKMEKGKCKQCGKAVQGKLFGSKEIVALSCAWCHEVYHNKESCFKESKIGEECKMGNYAPIIVPPSWIVKLPTKGNFKSSIRVNNKGMPNAKDKKVARANTKRNKKDDRKDQRAFIVKPIPSTEVIPVIVYINPKSGGNQGVKLLGKFQQILNPRQVFDLTQGGPKMGLELFRKAPNLRILACGGDGTVGWVLSVLDQLQPPITPPPAVGVLPLGTGNDLARALGWGGGYTDEPIGKILKEIGMSQSVLMDRWRLKVSPNEDVPDDNVDRSKDNVPLNVINNYFSFGVDAHIALEFHEAREAHPERFNSRLRNKMYYGQMGGKDLILRQYRNLSQWVTLECDGTDYTGKLRDAGCHAVLFLNIPSYGGGTHPWNDSFGQSKPSIDDGLIEVVGLTTYQLPMLQAGLHGTCICQCRTARITTKKTIPMQVDGEACRVKPCIIEMDLLNKAIMLAKRKHRDHGDVQVNPLEVLNLAVLRVTMDQYERYHYEKDMLRKLANKLGQVEIESQCDLEHVRNVLNSRFEESITYPKVSQDWCFIDACTAEHFFRVDRAQEHLHYICDIAVDELYILDHEAATMPQTPDQDRSFAAYSHRQAQNERRNMNNEGQSGPDDDLSMGSKPLKVFKFKSAYDRLFSFNEDVFGYGFSPILEQTTDAVLLAAQSGDLMMLRALHEQGYSLQSVNRNGETALHFACKYNHKDILKYIISCSTRRLINMRDKEKGETALHVAARDGKRDLCVMLVAAGANVEIRDMSGNTAMMVAFNRNHNEIASYLESQERFLYMDNVINMKKI
ncbi:eye-specific diacylglycerol kinase-like isoform X3 [Haematobia irritans]|uniref:eye-specific diacylglycerol kinase-like isoform X3 n=1 Tax=Haematobia irritans TaxID=7368 RepID=UPI003F508C16